MQPTYRPHRHQPAPGLKPKQLGSEHKGRSFRENQTPETLALEVQHIEGGPLTAKERAAMNVAAARAGQRNPSMMDELDRLLGPRRRGGIDSIVVLMVQTNMRLPLEEGVLPEWPRDRAGHVLIELCLALAFLALVGALVTSTGLPVDKTALVMAIGLVVGLGVHALLHCWAERHGNEF